jgi:SAM-dependent methyltransferase
MVAVATDLADYIGGTPGRFVPHEMRGELVEAEHVARYRWATRFAAGRRALDAGCGMAYGAAMLAEAGATAVTGIDLAEAVVEAARATAPAGVDLMTGDVRELPFEDGAFDLVVCFEVIEHIAEQDRAFAEFRRVLAPGGLLLASSPNRDVYVPGNPHHVHELTPAELQEGLERHFGAVRLVRQHDFVVSAVLSDAALRAADGAELPVSAVHKVAGREPGEETYTLALAGDALPSDDADVLVLAAPVEVRQWVEHYASQQRELERLVRLLDDAERRLTEHMALHARLAELETERERTTTEVEELWQRLQQAEAARRRVEEARSWKLTKPLRTAANRARRMR